MNRSIFIHLRDKGQFHFFWRVNLVMLLGNLRRLLLYQHIRAIRQHPALTPVIVPAAALVRMNSRHISIRIMLCSVPLQSQECCILWVFFKETLIVVAAVLFCLQLPGCNQV